MGMESVYKLSVVLNMVDQLTAPMGRASQNLGSQACRACSPVLGWRPWPEVG